MKSDLPCEVRGALNGRPKQLRPSGERRFVSKHSGLVWAMSKSRAGLRIRPAMHAICWVLLSVMIDLWARPGPGLGPGKAGQQHSTAPK